jgi:hypothetical protein
VPALGEVGPAQGAVGEGVDQVVQAVLVDLQPVGLLTAGAGSGSWDFLLAELVEMVSSLSTLDWSPSTVRVLI